MSRYDMLRYLATETLDSRVCGGEMLSHVTPTADEDTTQACLKGEVVKVIKRNKTSNNDFDKHSTLI
jgi:hypothetical protein